MLQINRIHGTLNISILPFVLLQASVLLVFTTHFSWTGLVLCALSYLIRMFAITGFYHRYFSHRTYAMGRTMQFIAAFLGATATQKGALWWAAHHRQHHRTSDTSADPHNSREGFWHAHWMWFLYRESSSTAYDKIPELVGFRELRLLDRFWYAPPVLMGLGLFALGGWHWVVWGYFVSTFLLSNGTYTINSLMHHWGRQRFYTGDESRNHWLLALLTLGEGWHNNHHRYQASTRNGFFWYEFDPTYYVLKLMSIVGLVRDLRPVPDKIMEEARLNRHLWRQARNRGVIFVPRRLGVRDLLVQMPFAAKGFVAESLTRVRCDMRGLGLSLAQRGDALGADVRALRSQIDERGQQLGREIRVLDNPGATLPFDLLRWSEQVTERGCTLRREIEALCEQASERGLRLRGEVGALGEQVAERSFALRREVEDLSAEVGAVSGRLLEEMEALKRQMAETVGQLADATASGPLCAVRNQVRMTAGQLATEVEALGDQMAERGHMLRREVEAWSGLLLHMA